MATNNNQIIHENLFSILNHEDESDVSNVSTDDEKMEDNKNASDNDNDVEPSTTEDEYYHDGGYESNVVEYPFRATVFIPAKNLSLTHTVDCVVKSAPTRENILEQMFKVFNDETFRILLMSNNTVKHFFLQTLFDFMTCDTTEHTTCTVPVSAFYHYGLCRPSEHVLMRWMHAYCRGEHQAAPSYYRDPDGTEKREIDSTTPSRDTVLLFEYKNVFEKLMDDLPTNAMRMILRDILENVSSYGPLLVYVDTYDTKTNTVTIKTAASRKPRTDQGRFASTIYYKLRDFIMTFQTIHIHAIRDMSTCLWEVPCWTSVAAHQLIHRHQYRFVNQLPRALSEFYYGNMNAPSFQSCHIHFDRNQKIDTRRCDWEIKKFTRLFSSFAAFNPSIKKRKQIILRQLYDIFIHLFSLPHITNTTDETLKLAFFRHALLGFEYDVMRDCIPDWVQLPYDAEFPSLVVTKSTTN